MSNAAATGTWVERIRGYVILSWAGPAVEAGTLAPFSVAPEGSFRKQTFATLALAQAYVRTAPSLRKVTVEFEAYVPVIERPRRALTLADPFELVPSSEDDPITCAQCETVITETEDGRWVDAEQASVCPKSDDDWDGRSDHSPHIVVTIDQIDEWVKFELGGGSMVDSPLSRYSLEPFDISIDVEEVE